MIGGDAAWLGYSGTLARIRTFSDPPADGRARGVLTTSSADVGVQRNGLSLERGNRRGWLRFGATGDQREPIGPLGRAASHVWSAALGTERGEHRLRASFAQRGHGAEQQLGFGEAASGESGEIGWRWRRGDAFADAAIVRSHDGRKSYDAGTLVIEESRRDAQTSGARLELGTRRGGNDVGVRIEAARERVSRQGGGAYLARVERWWAAVRLSRPLGDGTLDARLGGGWHSALRGTGDETTLAPGVSWTLDDERYRARLFVERAVTPVWSDLGPSIAPFLQSDWRAGFEVGAGHERAAYARVGFLAGRMRDRALVYRYPIRDVVLRIGTDRETTRSDAVLVTGAAGARWRAFGIAAEGYALDRDATAQQPAVDPPYGASVRADVSFRVFQGDLSVRAGGQLDVVGEREALAPLGVLPSYATSSAALELGIGDVVLTFRALNLEDEPRPDVWQDVATGEHALGPGREFRFDLTWVFFN